MAGKNPKAASPTIAGVVTVLIMTDGTCCVYEADGDASSTASPSTATGQTPRWTTCVTPTRWA